MPFVRQKIADAVTPDWMPPPPVYPPHDAIPISTIHDRQTAGAALAGWLMPPADAADPESDIRKE